MQLRYYAALAALVIVAACSAQNSTSNVPAARLPGAAQRAAASRSAPLASATTYPTPFPESTLIALTPNGPHTFSDLEGGITAGRNPTLYSVTVSGSYPPFTLNSAANQVVAGNNVSFSPTNNLTCTDNELDATGLPNGSTITAAPSFTGVATTKTNLVFVGDGYTFNFILRLGPDNISPPTQFGCRWYFQDSLLGIHRITMYAGGPTAHPMTISPSTIQLSGSYPFVNSPSQTITISEPDPNNAFNFGRTGFTFDGASLCTTVDGSDIGECRDAAPQTYDVNVAGAGSSNPPPHLLLRNLGPVKNQTLTLGYSGVAPNPVGSVTTMMIYDASGDYAPLTVNW